MAPGKRPARCEAAPCSILDLLAILYLRPALRPNAAQRPFRAEQQHYCQGREHIRRNRRILQRLTKMRLCIEEAVWSHFSSATAVVSPIVAVLVTVYCPRPLL